MESKANILVVDDEAVIRDGCTKILTKAGWDVETAENGRDGIELIKGKNFDILLLDLMMPGMNGLEVIQVVNEIAPDIYIVVITGYATIETAVEAMKRGAYDYIPKPFTPDQLRVVVKKALDNQALLLEAAYLREEQEKGLLAIAHEKSKIKTILNCMPNGVLVIDGEKRIALYNPIASKFLNISGDESIGEFADACIDCEDLNSMIYDVLNQVQNDSTIISGEIVGYNALPIMAHIAPVMMQDGDIVGAVAILQDISTQKAIDNMKADFIAKVTHELKSPVATINQLLMTLQEGVVGDLEKKQSEMIGRAREWGEGLLDLISDLLNISKIESGLSIQKKVPLNIKDEIENVIDLLKPQADKKKIAIDISMNNNLPVINADKDGMREVFTNLISNAIKYTDQGGEINIKGELDKDYVKVSVSDNGIGIDEKDMPFIFERFFRVKTKKTRQIMGTGLGLPIVKEIIDAHLGLIEVRSEEGRGSIFSVFLPRKVD
jgi:two-component system phosphate regulon sensor histidine kinase PhoR